MFVVIYFLFGPILIDSGKQLSSRWGYLVELVFRSYHFVYLIIHALSGRFCKFLVKIKGSYMSACFIDFIKRMKISLYYNIKHCGALY